MDHYRCFQVYDPGTSRYCITERCPGTPSRGDARCRSSGLVAADDLHPPVEILILAAATPEPTQDRSCVFILRRDACALASPPVSHRLPAEGGRVETPLLLPCRDGVGALHHQHRRLHHSRCCASKTQCYSRVPPCTRCHPSGPLPQPDQGATRTASCGAAPHQTWRCRNTPLRTPQAAAHSHPHAPPRDRWTCPRPTTTETGHDRTATPHEMTPPQQRVYSRPTAARMARLSRTGHRPIDRQRKGYAAHAALYSTPPST
jgi:hypothetical protein